MQQAWHIFKKDARHLYREIACLLVLAAVSGLMEEGDAANMSMIYAAAVAFTVARLVQAEAIPGENQFWTTRPYRWPSLLAAKFIFIIAFVQLPVMVAQMVVLVHCGFSPGAMLPGLLWTQVLILLAISLPSLALASLTPGLVPFISTILILVAIGFAAGQPSFRSLTFTPESFDWVRYSIPFLVTAIGVPPVLYIQYRDRRTRFSAILSAAILILGAVVFMALPWSALFKVQTLLSRQAFPLQITRDLGKPFELRRDDLQQFTISLPLVISGVPPDVRTQVEVFELQWQRSDGSRQHLISAISGRVGLHHPERDQNRITVSGAFFPDRDFVKSAAERRATLLVSFYFTLFGNRHSKTIPWLTRPVPALDDLQCLDYFHDVVCRAPFRWPAGIVSVSAPWYGANSFTHLISYSPFPANLQLTATVERSAGPHWSKDAPAQRDITIEVEEPLAYLRRDVEIPNVVLEGR